MKTTLIATVLFVFSFISVNAQPHPQDQGYNFVQNVSYVSADETDEYRKERCVLDIYYPDTDKGFATLVWFHGGGLEGGNKKLIEGFMGHMPDKVRFIICNKRLQGFKINIKKCAVCKR